MKKWGGLTLALLVGCATGAALRDLVVPARAQGNVASYGYRKLFGRDLIRMAKGVDPNLKGDDEAIERGMNELGKQGWRFVQVHSEPYQVTTYYFEARSGQ